MNENGSIPIVRLTLEHMQHSILMAFSEHAAAMDADVQAAVKGYCTKERIAQAIADSVSKGIERAIEDEVRSFYAYGAGRAVIKRAVLKHLEMAKESGE